VIRGRATCASSSMRSSMHSSCRRGPRSARAICLSASRSRSGHRPRATRRAFHRRRQHPPSRRSRWRRISTTFPIPRRSASRWLVSTPPTSARCCAGRAETCRQPHDARVSIDRTSGASFASARLVETSSTPSKVPRVTRLGPFFFTALCATTAYAQSPFDLDDDEKKDKKADEGFGEHKTEATEAKKSVHPYTLDECLGLAERNNPNLWAARARLAFTHAQLEEAKTFPFWQFGVQATGGVIPAITGTNIFTHSSISALNPNLTAGIQPFVRVDFWGALPLWTFGKIEAGKKAAEANIRVNEWDLEKVRQLARMDVRRAYFGV